MNFPGCWSQRTLSAFVAMLIFFACGCEPEANIAKPNDATASPPAVVASAEPSLSAPELAADDVFSDESSTSAKSSSASETDNAQLQPAMNQSSGALQDKKNNGQGSETVANGDSAKDTAETDTASGEGRTFEANFLCWNIESDGSDPKVIAQQLTELGTYNVYALTEFPPSAKELFEETLGGDYELIMSRSGYKDRLAIAFDTRLFELIKSFEIEKINYKNRYRSPLVAHLKHKKSGMEFFVMNNHLARGREGVRLIQTKQLVAWARTQLLPVVALGDYNLDYVFETQKGNESFASMLHDNVWKWIKPVEMIDTNWYDNPEEPDGKDDYPGSMLDFAFVSGPAKAWNARCTVIVRPDDFPDDEQTSDHRPFELTVSN